MDREGSRLKRASVSMSRMTGTGSLNTVDVHMICTQRRTEITMRSSTQLSSIQDGSMCSENPYALCPVSEVSPTLPLKRLQYLSFQGRWLSTFSFHASLLQAISGVMSLASCPHVVSQAPQCFRSSKMQATFTLGLN